MQVLLREGHDATFRDPYAPLPYCRISQFLAASFAGTRRFRDFPKFGTFGGCASGERDGEYSESARSTLTKRGRPSEPACCFVFVYRFGCWGTPVGPTPTPRPHRAQRWRQRAAHCGAIRQSPNRPIARRIRRRRERPGLQRVRRFRLRRIGVSAAAEAPPPSAVQVDAAALCRGQW